MGKNRVSIRDYSSPREFLKSYLRVEAKIKIMLLWGSMNIEEIYETIKIFKWRGQKYLNGRKLSIHHSKWLNTDNSRL